MAPKRSTVRGSFESAIQIRSEGGENYEVYLNRAQIDAGLKDAWSKLKGKQAAIAVSLFISHEYNFHKFNAVGDGQPY